MFIFKSGTLSIQILRKYEIQYYMFLKKIINFYTILNTSRYKYQIIIILKTLCVINDYHKNERIFKNDII